MNRSLPIIVSDEVNIDGYVLYPDELGNGVSLSEAERIEFYECYSNIYPEIIINITNEYMNSFSCSRSVATAIVQHAVVPLLHVFFEMSVRIKKALESSDIDLYVIEQPVTSLPKTIEDFKSRAKSSIEFNQSLIFILGTMWGLKVKNEKIIYEISETHQSSFVNHNSRLYKRDILNGLKYRLYKVYYRLAGLFSKPKIISIGMSMVSNVFMVKGIYSRYVQPINVKWKVSNVTFNNSLRQSIFKQDILDTDAIDKLFNKMELNTNEINSYKKSLVNFLQQFFPVESLELFSEYIKMSESELTKYNQKYFLTGGAANTKVTYLLAVARRKGLRLLRLQHGGYYGYYKNQKWSPHYENCDRYFTWGWECYFNVENLGVEFTPFISPWLSERKKYWMHYNSKLVKNKPNNYDVLIAPTRLAPYISVSGVNTCDEIITRASDLIDIVRELVDDELKVLYKPPSIISSRSYKRALDRMSELGKNNFEVIKKIDKGLTVELFDDVSIVLWDTLGTGFLECVACGIPTIVYLPSYTLFEDNIRHLLTKLEEVHVVHTTPKSIPYTIKKFNKNPMDWMRQSERHKVLQQFSKAFCRTSNNWDEYLMASVKSKQI